MKRFYPFIYWSLGILIIVAILYFFVLRFPGYIYYFDASGSFDIRRPFDQYLFTYTPYDSTEVGIKNRLPTMSVVGGIFYLLKPLLHLTNQDLIKIGYTLLFIGAYSAFYYVFPKFVAFFINSNDRNKEGEMDSNYFIRTILSLMYVMVPFFTFRLTMLHLFYLTTFYPLITYIYLKIVSTNKISLRNILLFGILTFFGFSYSNILIYYVVTFICLGLPFLFSKKGKKQIGLFFLNMIMLFVVVLATNIYWIIPYIIKGSPSPGYIVTDNMIETLSQKSTWLNVLTDSSEWFVGQGKNVMVLVNFSQYYLLAQISGIFTFYAYMIYGLIISKRGKVIIAIVLLNVLVLGLIMKESPLYQYFYTKLVFEPFGWMLREPNRIRFIFSFWAYLFFSLSIFHVSSKSDNDNSSKKLYLVLFSIVTYLCFVMPWFVSSLNYLKPTEIPKEIIQLNTELSKTSNYSFIQRYPFIGEYRLSWVENKFILADSLNYKYLPYLLSRPSTQPGGMIPTVRSKESYISEMMLRDKSIVQKNELLTRLGIENILIDKNAIPLYPNSEYSGESLVNLNSAFNNSLAWKLVYSDNTYDLLQSTLSFANSIELSNHVIVTAEPLKIIDKIEISSTVNTDIMLQHYDTETIPEDATILTYNDSKEYYLDYLSPLELKSYTTYPFEFTNHYGEKVDWGRASLLDKGGAEFSKILRFYDIPVFQYLADDKVAYSSNPIKSSDPSRMSYEIKTNNCKDVKCALFAKVLFSKIGGRLSITINGRSYEINTKSDTKEGFYWVTLNRQFVVEEDNNTILLKNEGGFAAIGGIVLIPESTYSDVILRVAKHDVIQVAYDQKERVKLTNQSDCVSNAKYFDSIIPHVSVNGTCSQRSNLKLKQFQSEFLYIDKQTGKASFTSAPQVVGSFNGEIWFFSKTDLILWILFAITYVIIIVFIELIVLGHVR